MGDCRPTAFLPGSGLRLSGDAFVIPRHERVKPVGSGPAASCLSRLKRRIIKRLTRNGFKSPLNQHEFAGIS